MHIVPYDTNHFAECEAILSALPEWFGIPESNEEYLRNLGRLPTWVALRDARVVGVIALEWHSDQSSEIQFMAVAPSLHRSGVGRALLGDAESEARDAGARWLHVKTLAPSHPDPHYARTREFYRAMGFEPLFESPTIWGSENPALVMVKRV